MSDAFKILNAINTNDHTEKKNGLTYLSWAWAWAELKKVYPDATYTIKHFDGKPYLFDENLGYMVMTEMTVDGITHEMWLPVMDNTNKAMKNREYTIKKGKYESTVQPATMFDINTAIMRCLTKNIAMFGLGLYIYAGEDLPEEEAGKAQAEIEKIENSVVSLAKVMVIRNKCTEYGVSEQQVCGRFDINRLEEMTEEMFMRAVKMFDATEKK